MALTISSTSRSGILDWTAAIAAESDVTVGYHEHYWEFTRIDNSPALRRRLLVGSQSVEKASEGSARFVASLTAVVGVGDVEGGFIDGG